MSKKPETLFTEKVDTELKRLFGNDIFIENIQQAAKIGTPDRLICLNGLFVALEIKTDEGKPTKLQLLKLAKIERAGGFSAIVTPTTWPFVREELTSIFGLK